MTDPVRDSRYLLTERTGKLFLRYLLPSLCGAFFTSFYVLTDTMMIGHGVGDQGLTALNILLPMYSVFMATGYLFGVGGGVCISVAGGVGDHRTVDAVFTTALTAVTGLGLAATVLCSLFLGELVDFLGATAANRPYAMVYGRIMMGTALLFFLQPFFLSVVKNDEDPKRVMIGSVVGNLWNVVWDYLLIFVFHRGMTGAILATVMGFGLNLLICAGHLRSKKNHLHFRYSTFRPALVRKTCRCGLASFFGEFSAAVILYFFNIRILEYLGEEALLIYSVIGNAAIVTGAMLQGVGNAAQPLLSYNFGAGRGERVNSIRSIGLTVSGLAAVILYGTGYLWTGGLIGLFVADPGSLLGWGIPVVRLYFSGTLFQGISMFLGTYFQSVMRAWESAVVGILRGILLPLVLIMTLPEFFGGKAIWAVIPLTEIITVVLALVLLLKKEQR